LFYVDIPYYIDNKEAREVLASLTILDI